MRSEDSLMNHVFSGTECASKTWMCNFKNLTCPFHLGSEEDNTSGYPEDRESIVRSALPRQHQGLSSSRTRIICSPCPVAPGLM